MNIKIKRYITASNNYWRHRIAQEKHSELKMKWKKRMRFYEKQNIVSLMAQTLAEGLEDYKASRRKIK